MVSRDPNSSPAASPSILPVAAVLLCVLRHWLKVQVGMAFYTQYADFSCYMAFVVCARY